MRLLFYIYSGQYYQLFSLEKKKKWAGLSPRLFYMLLKNLWLCPFVRGILWYPNICLQIPLNCGNAAPCSYLHVDPCTDLSGHSDWFLRQPSKAICPAMIHSLSMEGESWAELQELQLHCDLPKTFRLFSTLQMLFPDPRNNKEEYKVQPHHPLVVSS